MEKEETVEMLKKELAKLTEPTPKQKALDAYEAIVRELLDLEEKIKDAQQRHQEALGNLQRALVAKEEK